MSKVKIPDTVADVIIKLEEAGYEAYAVGGCVRDSIMGLTPQDWDVTTSAAPEKTMEIFGDRAIPTGLQYGTVSVKCDGCIVEVTTFRTDGVYTDNRRPDSIAYASSLPEDLSRRDFTVNAIAYSLSDEIIDPFNGLRDINNRLLRAVGTAKDRFEEDALRMFRGLRIAAKLGLSIHPNTFSAIYEKAHLAAFLSAERIRDEFKKILVCPNTYMITCVFESGLMASFGLGSNCPDLEDLGELPIDGYSRLSGLCYALKKHGVISSPKCFLEDLHYDRHSIKVADAVSQLLMSGIPSDAKAWKKLMFAHGDEVCITAALVAKALDKYMYSDIPQEIILSGECWNVKTLAIDGNTLIDLGYAGKSIGQELEELVSHVIESPEDNTEERLINLAKEKLKK